MWRPVRDVQAHTAGPPRRGDLPRHEGDAKAAVEVEDQSTKQERFRLESTPSLIGMQEEMQVLERTNHALRGLKSSEATSQRIENTERLKDLREARSKRKPPEVRLEIVRNMIAKDEERHVSAKAKIEQLLEEVENIELNIKRHRAEEAALVHSIETQAAANVEVGPDGSASQCGMQPGFAKVPVTDQKLLDITNLLSSLDLAPEANSAIQLLISGLSQSKKVTIAPNDGIAPPQAVPPASPVRSVAPTVIETPIRTPLAEVNGEQEEYEYDEAMSSDGYEQWDKATGGQEDAPLAEAGQENPSLAGTGSSRKSKRASKARPVPFSRRATVLKKPGEKP